MIKLTVISIKTTGENTLVASSRTSKQSDKTIAGMTLIFKIDFNLK
jgi:hypothetical protein